MTDFIEDAAKWLADDDTAYADMEDARRAAKAMLGPALAENERLRAALEKIRNISYYRPGETTAKLDDIFDEVDAALEFPG